MLESMFAMLDNNVLDLLRQGNANACAKIDAARAAGEAIYISPSIVGEIVNTPNDEVRGGLIDAALRYCDGRTLCDASELVEHELRTNTLVARDVALRRREGADFADELQGLRSAKSAATLKAQVASAFRSREEWAGLVDEQVQRIKAEHGRTYYRSFERFCGGELTRAAWQVLGPSARALGYPEPAGSADECLARQASVVLYLAALFRRLNDLPRSVACFSDIRPIIEASYAPWFITNDESLWRSWSLAAYVASPPPSLQIHFLREDSVPPPDLEYERTMTHGRKA